jgi:hypothetical protein
MAALDFLKKLFSGKKSLKDISLDDLKRERIRLEQEQRKYTKRSDEVEDEKKQLFMAGKDEASHRKQAILAQRIKEKDVEGKNIEKNLQFFSYQLRIIGGFIQLKENQRILKQSGISAIINKVDLQDLERYVDESTVDGEFNINKLTDILGTLEESERIVGPMKEDKDIERIVAAMQEARAAEEADPEATRKGLEKLSGILTKDKEAAAED